MSCLQDDVGAPLICHLNNIGNVQVGLFQSLGSFVSSDDLELVSDPRESCTKAYEMRFSLLVNDRLLIEKIEQFDLSGLVFAYFNCGFI